MNMNNLNTNRAATEGKLAILQRSFPHLGGSVIPTTSSYFPVFEHPRIEVPNVAHGDQLLWNQDRDVCTSTRSSTSPSLSTTKGRNSLSLSEKLVGDVTIAAAVTAAAAPFLTIIDKALVQRSAGSHTVLSSAKESCVSMISQPRAYLKSPTFLWMWATYASTYTAANVLDTWVKHKDEEVPLQQTTRSFSKSLQRDQEAPTAAARNGAVMLASLTGTHAVFMGTTAVNTTASLIKDGAYAKLFGSTTTATNSGGGGTTAAAAPQRVPAAAYALWVLRDVTVIGSSFILPEHVARLAANLGNQYYCHENTLSGHASASSSSSSNILTTSAVTTTGPARMYGKKNHRFFTQDDFLPAAQIITPMAAQVIAGPLHYMGLDLTMNPSRNNNNNNTSKKLVQVLHQRLATLRANFGTIVVARMVRILPGYGIAGVWNRRLRHEYRAALLLQQR